MTKPSSPFKSFMSNMVLSNLSSRLSGSDSITKLLRNVSPLVFCFIGIIFGEIVTTYFNTSIGLVTHGAILVIILIHGAILKEVEYQRLFLTFALVPLTRLISLSIPLSDYNLPFWYLIVGIPLLVSSVFVTYYSKYQMKDVGLSFPPNISFQIIIGALGIILGFLEYQILQPIPLVSSLTFNNLVVPSLILIVFTGFLEEFFFRGLMQKSFTDAFGSLVGICFVSLVFAVLHIGYRSLLDVVFVFLVALLFGWIVQRTRSILGVSLAHGVTNIFLYLVFPLIFS